MYTDIKITPEEETEYIEKVAQKVIDSGMETAAILALESSKPLVFIGGELGRFFILPFIPIVSENWGNKGEKIVQIFEKRTNIERLLKRIEEKNKENEEKKKEQKALEKARKAEEAKAKAIESSKETSTEKKSWWKKIIPG